MKRLREWHRRGTGPLAARLAAIGAIAGVAAWLVALGLHRVFEAERPDTLVLALAIARGAFIGALLGIILGILWSRKRDGNP